MVEESDTGLQNLGAAESPAPPPHAQCQKVGPQGFIDRGRRSEPSPSLASPAAAVFTCLPIPWNQGLTDHGLTPSEPHGGVEVGRFGFFWSCTFAVFSVAHEASFSIPSTNFVRGTRGPDGFSSSDSRQHRTMRHPFNRTRGKPPNHFRKASDRARCAPTNTTDQPIRGDAACRLQIHSVCSSATCAPCGGKCLH